MSSEKIRVFAGKVVTATALAVRESQRMTASVLGLGHESRWLLLDDADEEMQKLVDVLYEQIERVQNEQTRIVTTKKALQKLASEGAINNGEKVTNG
jgi:hypothetical protein